LKKERVQLNDLKNRTPWIFPFRMGTAGLQVASAGRPQRIPRRLDEEETKGGKTPPDNQQKRETVEERRRGTKERERHEGAHTQVIMKKRTKHMKSLRRENLKRTVSNRLTEKRCSEQRCS
jgi:hypothetical protein